MISDYGYGPFGGKHNVVSNSLAVHGAAKALSLGHYGQNAIAKAVGKTASAAGLTKHGHAISAAHGVYGANSKALTHGGGHAFSQAHSKGNSNSLSANYGKGHAVSYATGRKKRSVYGYPKGRKYYPFGGKHNVVSNSLAVHGAAKALSLGHYGQNAIAKAVGKTASAAGLTKHGHAISAAHGVYGANSKALTHGGGHAFSQAHSKGNSNSLSANYGYGNSISYATGRKKRSIYNYGYGPFGGKHNVVSNSLAVHGAAKALSLGHYGQNAIAKSVGKTASAAGLTKYGHAISSAHGVYGANSKALTHGGGHAFSQAHSKGNSNSLSANYGYGNSVSYATGRKKRSVYNYGYGPFGGRHNVVSNSLAVKGAAKSVALGHYGQNVNSKAVGLTASSAGLTQYGHAISGAYGKYGANSKALTHGGGHAISNSHSFKNSNSLAANYGKGGAAFSYATGRKRRSVYAYPKGRKYYPFGGKHNVVSNSLAVHGAAKALSLGHYGQNAIAKSVGLTATSGAKTLHGHAISAAHGVYGANSKALTHGGGHAFSQAHSKGNSNSLSANYGYGNSVSYATGRKRRSASLDNPCEYFVAFPLKRIPNMF
ncbi:hypothetical protein FSP39_017869 [Pinctada imbricata]|uniref:Uncharacterized protein n=1 Tax=Pinctada imbricata TaxID=66713 RepID=A0AA89BT87_PINIB|nr:hypothetical protein FSP39_017869 [Pinctada imbricata]